MSSIVHPIHPSAKPVDRIPARPPRLDLVLLGPGKVGTAMLRFLAAPEFAHLRLLGVANSRHMLTAPGGLDPRQALPRLSATERDNDLAALTDYLLSHAEHPPVIIDATASDQVAGLHSEWLARDIHVVTANKTAAAQGWVRHGEYRARYGDAATVGAGLPILASLRRLRAAGDRITRVEGVLSGSLAYLFHALEAGRDFSAAVTEAQHQGYTEPDPRCDLGGQDVARKLAIVARAAGFALPEQPLAESLIPAAAPFPTTLRKAGGEDFLVNLEHADAAWRARVEQADRQGEVLRYVACATAENTYIETRAVPRHTPLAQTRGAEICVVIHSAAYREQPLVIRGPGAGVEVTARALLADMLQV